MKENMQDLINHLNPLKESRIITIKHGDWAQLLIMAKGGVVVASLRPLK